MKRVTLVWIFKNTYNMTLSSPRTERFGHFEIVNVIAKTTSRVSLGGKFETSTANTINICQRTSSIVPYKDINLYNKNKVI